MPSICATGMQTPSGVFSRASLIPYTTVLAHLSTRHTFSRRQKSRYISPSPSTYARLLSTTSQSSCSVSYIIMNHQTRIIANPSSYNSRSLGTNSPYRSHHSHSTIHDIHVSPTSTPSSHEVRIIQVPSRRHKVVKENLGTAENESVDSGRGTPIAAYRTSRRQSVGFL